MEDLQEVARMILLQVDHNRECGKDDKFTKDEIADIINRRVVKKLTIPAVVGRSEQLCVDCNTRTAKIGNQCISCNHGWTKK